MAKPLLLLVHGVGTHSKSWADHVIARLTEIAATFPDIASSGPLGSQIVMKPLHYDSVFDAQLDRWRQLGSRTTGFTNDSAIKLPSTIYTTFDPASGEPLSELLQLSLVVHHC